MANFRNQATLSYNNTVTNSNVAQGKLVEVLSATKTAVMNDYVANDDVTFIISIVNSGATELRGVTVIDTLGSYAFGDGTLYPLTYESGSLRYYQNGALQTAPEVAGGPPLTITGITVPERGNAILIFEATVNQYAPLAAGAIIENKATIGGGGLSQPLEVQEIIVPEIAPNLTISKLLSPNEVVENGRLTYTFVLQNTGNTEAVAADEVVITDTFDPKLSDLVVSLDGVAWTEGTEYLYNSATGLFETVARQITVPAATYTQDAVAGHWITTPGVTILTVTGTV